MGLFNEPTTPAEPKAPRTDEQIAATIYPTKNEQFQDIGEDGRPREDIIRDTSGLILHRGQHYGNVEALIRYNSRELNNAMLTDLTFLRELSGIKAQNAVFAGSSFEEIRDSDLSGSDLRNGTFGSLRGCNLLNVKIDESTDLTNCDLTGARYSLEEIKKAKGWRSCRGLRMDADKQES